MKPHFHLFGIPVRVELFFFLLVGFLGWSAGRPAPLLIAWVVIVFVSILWHEMGHAFAFRRFGYPPTIVLHGFGGATSSLAPVKLSPRKDILISLAGPAAGMLLGGAVFTLSRYTGVGGPPASMSDVWLQVIVDDLLFVNIAWGIFNLLPMLPLDGGRVMAASLDLATKGRGQTPALVVSLAVGAALALAAFATGNMWAALLVLFLSMSNFAALQERRRLAPHKENIQSLKEGYEALDRRDVATAAERAAAVLADPKSTEVKASATSLLMWTQMEQGRFQDAARLGEEAFEERREPYLAFHVARAWARAGWPRESLDWLAKAVDNGYADVKELDAEPDLASVRASSEYGRLRDRIQRVTTAETEAPETEAPEPEAPEPESGLDPATGAAHRQQAAEPPAAGPRPQPGAVVKAILLVNVLVFLAQRLQPGLTADFGQSPQAIAAGQWYRLLTPMLLHADFIHIGFNSYALWIYGPALERIVGRFRFLALYVIAGFTGAVASYTFGQCPSLGVGASGAIFGIIGALLVFNFNRRKISRAGAANLQGILLIIGLNLLIGFTVPQIDNFAHMGGLAGGILVGAAFDFSGNRKLPGAVSLAAQSILPAAVVAAAAALAVHRTLTFTCGS